MSTHRKLALGAGAVLAATALALAGSVASFATTAPRPAATGAAAGVGPNPDAPHVGTVSGVQTGPNISIRNPESVRAFRQLHQQMLSRAKGTQPGQASTIHEYLGTSFDNEGNSMGSQATQSVSTKIKPADSGTTLYTPTMYPSGGSQGSCIEISTAYFQSSQVVAAWDWCQAITFVAQVNINKAFMKTYTQNQNYSVQIKQTKASNNTWTAYLYNYQKKDWEKFYAQNGTGQTGLSDGWDLYELYSDIAPSGQSYACADLKGKRVEAQKIMVDLGGTWSLANTTNAGNEYDVPVSAFDCKSLTYAMVTQYSHWKAKG
jgi:hypothetical protein